MKKILIIGLFIVIPICALPQNPDSFVFKSETSIIQEKMSNEEPSSMFDIRRNSVTNETILLFWYERIFPVSDKFGITAKAGIMIFDPFFLIGETGTLFGGPKHFFEAGVGAVIDPYGDFKTLTLRIGYRYQAFKGFIFKLSPLYAIDEGFVPLITIGYAF